MTLELLTRFLGPLGLVVLLLASLFALNWFLSHLLQRHPEKNLQKQLFMLMASLLLMLVTIICATDQ